MWATARLEIRPIAVADAEELFAALNDPEVGRYIGGPEVTTVDALRSRIEALLAGPPREGTTEKWLNYAVRSPDQTNQVIGRLEATVYGEWAEVAWVLGAKFWGQGYGTEGARWLVRHLEREHAVRELWATVEPRNRRSIRLLERLDFAPQPIPARRSPESYDEGDLVFALMLH